MQRLSLVCLQKVRHIQMQMGGDVFAALDMPGDTENLDRENFRRDRHCRHARFLVCLLACHGKKILHAVGVPAEPRPGVINVVIRQQRFCSRRVYNPA